MRNGRPASATEVGEEHDEELGEDFMGEHEESEKEILSDTMLSDEKKVKYQIRVHKDALRDAHKSLGALVLSISRQRTGSTGTHLPVIKYDLVQFRRSSRRS